MSRVAIIGAGNMGAYLATQLKLAGHEVFFCVRRTPPIIRFEGLPPFQFRFFFRHPPPADIVLLTVKTYDTPSALFWLPMLCPNNQPVAVIQNGVNHAERVAPFPAIPVLSYVYVEAQQGVYRAFLPEHAHFTVPALSSCTPFADLFANTSIQVAREGAFHTAAWRKMLQNCVSNPLTTIAGRGLEIFAEPEYRELAENVLAEAFPIAQADGARVRATEVNKILKVLASYPAGTRTSMLQDFEQGKRLELDCLTGTLIEVGRRYGLPTAVNEDVIERIRARQKEIVLRKEQAKSAQVAEIAARASAPGSHTSRRGPATPG